MSKTLRDPSKLRFARLTRDTAAPIAKKPSLLDAKELQKGNLTWMKTYGLAGIRWGAIGALGALYVVRPAWLNSLFSFNK